LRRGRNISIPFAEAYTKPNSRKINKFGEGRFVKLASAEDHPSSVMDMSFADRAFSAEYMLMNAKKFKKQAYGVPYNIDTDIARLTLNALGVRIDKRTPELKKYLASWEMGT
jgi:adenosylhomocysteinase